MADFGVPLSRQVVEILRELVVITGRQQYVFPAIGGGGRPISENHRLEGHGVAREQRLIQARKQRVRIRSQAQSVKRLSIGGNWLVCRRRQ